LTKTDLPTPAGRFFDEAVARMENKMPFKFRFIEAAGRR
jgi:hypothetical protein